jgi:hypothetical protein
MAVRRNMTDALPPEQIAFIKGEAPPATVTSTSDKSRSMSLVVFGRNNPSPYTVNGRPLYVHLNGLAVVLLK